MTAVQICPSMAQFNELKDHHDLVTHGGSWVSQMTANVPLRVTPAINTDESRYDGIMRGTFSDGSTWVMGGIQKSIDFTYFAKGRTANGNDGRIRFDIPNSRVHANFTGNGANITSLNAANLASGTVPNARFPNGGVTVRNAAYFASNEIQAYRSGKVVIVRVGGDASFSAWADNVRICTLDGVNFVFGEASVYGQDTGRCITLYGSGNGVYVRNKNNVTLNTWFFGELVGISST